MSYECVQENCDVPTDLNLKRIKRFKRSPTPVTVLHPSQNR